MVPPAAEQHFIDPSQNNRVGACAPPAYILAALFLTVSAWRYGDTRCGAEGAGKQPSAHRRPGRRQVHLPSGGHRLTFFARRAAQPQVVNSNAIWSWAPQRKSYNGIKLRGSCRAQRQYLCNSSIPTKAKAELIPEQRLCFRVQSDKHD